MAKRDIGKHFIGQHGGGLGYAAGATTGAESPLLAGKRPQSPEVAVVAVHPEKAVRESAALQVGLEFPVNMVWQGFALLSELVNQGRVVRFDELVEWYLLGLMALVDGLAKCILAWRQHTELIPRFVVPKSRTMKQSVLAWNI